MTQLHYLSAIAWELPTWRLAGAILLGPIFGILLTSGLGKDPGLVENNQERQKLHSALGYALLLVSLLGWLIWDPLAEQGLLWILFILWGILVPLMGKLIPWLEGMESSRRKKGIQQGLLAVIVIFGLSLRLSGLFHGLPQYIVHCDTPKQLALIPNFVQGDFAPPTSYPVGHIYLYSGIIKLFQWLLGQADPCRR